MQKIKTILSNFSWENWLKLVLLATIFYITFFLIIIDIAYILIIDTNQIDTLYFYINVYKCTFTFYLKMAQKQMRKGGNRFSES